MQLHGRSDDGRYPQNSGEGMAGRHEVVQALVKLPMWVSSCEGPRAASIQVDDRHACEVRRAARHGLVAVSMHTTGVLGKDRTAHREGD